MIIIEKSSIYFKSRKYDYLPVFVLFKFKKFKFNEKKNHAKLIIQNHS